MRNIVWFYLTIEYWFYSYHRRHSRTSKKGLHKKMRCCCSSSQRQMRVRADGNGFNNFSNTVYFFSNRNLIHTMQGPSLGGKWSHEPRNNAESGISTISKPTCAKEDGLRRKTPSLFIWEPVLAGSGWLSLEPSPVGLRTASRIGGISSREIKTSKSPLWMWWWVQKPISN